LHGGGAGWYIQQSFGGSWPVFERGYLMEPDEIMEKRELYIVMSAPVIGFCNVHIVESHESFDNKNGWE